MESQKARRFLVIAVVCMTYVRIFPSANAQGLVGSQDAQIVVSGEADVLISPTKASLSVEVKSAAGNAAAASSDNARTTKAVMDALKAADLLPGEVVSSQISVGPRWSYDESSRRQKRTAFEATNTIQIDTERLDRVAAYIDSALSAGATGVSEVKFLAKDTSGARRQALGEAVADARRDAEAIAHAGGGKLGDLVLLSTEQSNKSPGVSLEEIVVTGRRNEATVNTQIVPPQIKVTARVLARWKFVPNGTAK